MPSISFKVSAEEARAIRARARAEKRTVSALIRATVLPKKPAPRPRLVIKKHPVSGLPYNAAGKNLPVVTREQVAALLADFP